MRTLKVHMLDGTLKTMLVDDSQPVANLMVVICTKIGEYKNIPVYIILVLHIFPCKLI